MYKLKKEYKGHTVNTAGYALLLDTVRHHQVEILELQDYFEKETKTSKTKQNKAVGGKIK